MQVPAYEIVLARREHLAALAEVELSAATLFHGFAPAGPVLGECTPLKVLAEAQRERRLWVALTADAPVGFALVTMIAQNHPHLQEMDVLPGHGRRGLGTALLRAVCAWASEKGYREITLTTFRSVAWNMPFYGRFGFVEVPGELQGPELKAIVEDERSRGLDPLERVVMSCRIHPVATP